MPQERDYAEEDVVDHENKENASKEKVDDVID
jgi:hypothetical protein